MIAGVTRRDQQQQRTMDESELLHKQLITESGYFQ